MAYNLRIVIVLSLFFIPLNVQGQSSHILFSVDNNTVPRNYLLLPVPRDTIFSHDELHLEVDNKKIPSDFYTANYWPIKGENAKAIRLLLIAPTVILSGEYRLSWTVNREQAIKYKELKVNESAELVYPNKEWLQRSALLHSSPSKESWYLLAQKKYANYVASLSKGGEVTPSNSKTWLYDRPATYFQLFLLSGEEKWKKIALAELEQYMNHITSDGHFSPVKKFDVKYLMSKGGALGFFLSGRQSFVTHLEKLYRSSLKWESKYSEKTGFWTERSQSAALVAALMYWEVTGDKEAKTRVDKIIDDTVNMTFTPSQDWSLRNCPQHSYNAHEGEGGRGPVCSPWMMALLGDGLWRYYLLTGDSRASALLDGFGDFILDSGIYIGNGKFENQVLPRYLTALENQSQDELNPWADIHHSCDVAALLGKSNYIKSKKEEVPLINNQLFRALLGQCKNLHKEQKGDAWRITPLRKFAWTFTTTSELTWLEELFL